MKPRSDIPGGVDAAAEQVRVGDEFTFQNGRWICLEVKRTRMLALEPDLLHLASIHLAAPVEKTGGRWTELVAWIEKAHAKLKPGGTIWLEGGQFRVLGTFRNGDMRVTAVDPLDPRLGLPRIMRIRKWAPWWASVVPAELYPFPRSLKEVFARMKR